MANVHKRALINRVAENLNQPQENVKSIIDCFTDELIANLSEDNDIEFRGFGVFRVKNRPGRKGINPKTQATVEVPAKRHIHFKMGNTMKKLIQG